MEDLWTQMAVQHMAGCGRQNDLPAVHCGHVTNPHSFPSPSSPSGQLLAWDANGVLLPQEARVKAMPSWLLAFQWSPRLADV